MIVDPRDFEKRNPGLQAIMGSQNFSFVLVGNHILDNARHQDDRQWHFKADNNPEVIKFLQENEFKVSKVPYYSYPIPITHLSQFQPPQLPSTLKGCTDLPPFKNTNILNEQLEEMHRNYQAALTRRVNNSPYVPLNEIAEFSNVTVDRAIYSDGYCIVVVDLIDNYSDYTEALISLFTNRHKFGNKTFSSQENIDSAVNIAIAVKEQMVKSSKG